MTDRWVVSCATWLRVHWKLQCQYKRRGWFKVLEFVYMYAELSLMKIPKTKTQPVVLSYFFYCIMSGII